MANMTFGVNIIPKSNANVSIGNSDNPWTIVSPVMTGTPTAPTATGDTNNTQVATTAFVKANVVNTLDSDSTTNALSAAQGKALNEAAFKYSDANASIGYGYGTCSTAAATTGKEASLTGYDLRTGSIVSIRFTNAVPASATLNINSKGAKSIMYRNAAIAANIIRAGDTATFVYDGTYYHLISIDPGNLTWGQLYNA